MNLSTFHSPSKRLGKYTERENRDVVTLTAVFFVIFLIGRPIGIVLL